MTLRLFAILIISALGWTGCATRPGLQPASADERFLGIPAFSGTRTGHKDTFLVSDLDAPLRQLKFVTPNIPGHLSVKRESGRVTLQFVITETGDVADVQVVRASHPDYAASAVSAVSQWKFSPPIKGGKAVAIRAIQELPFLVR